MYVLDARRTVEAHHLARATLARDTTTATTTTTAAATTTTTTATAATTTATAATTGLVSHEGCARQVMTLDEYLQSKAYSIDDS